MARPNPTSADRIRALDPVKIGREAVIAANPRGYAPGVQMEIRDGSRDNWLPISQAILGARAALAAAIEAAEDRPPGA